MPVVDVTGSIYLSVGEGATADSITIMTAGAGNGTWLSKQSAFVYTTPKPSDPTTFLTLTLNFSGADANDLWDQYRAVEKKLYQARQSQGPYGHGQNVTLGVQLFQANLAVFFDVVDGKIDLP